MENITEQLKAALAATRDINQLESSKKELLLTDLAAALRTNVDTILFENNKDLQLLNLDDPKRDRLVLNKERVAALAQSVLDVANLPDPAAQLLSRQVLENGLILEKKAVPLGVVAVIYESRPNVTIDVAALCLRSGNVCLLRGGTDAFHTNSILVQIIHEVLLQHQLNPNVVQLLPTDRKFVLELLTALHE